MNLRATLATVLAAGALGGAAAAAPLAQSGTSAYPAEIAAAKGAMMAEPQKAYDHSRLALAAAHGDPMDAAAADWLAGEALTRLKRPAEAMVLLDKILPVVRASAPGSKLEGDVLRSRGRAAGALAKVQNALSDFRAAFRIYQAVGEPRSQAIALQEIGGIYLDARDYPHVVQYYAQARDIFDKDPSLALATHNNLAIAYKEMGRLAESEAEFRKALQIADDLKSGALQAHILTNIAFAEALDGRRDAARADAERGLTLAARDPEASSERPFLLGVEAKVAAAANDNPAAAALLNQAFRGVDLSTTTLDWRDFHEVAAQVYERTGAQGAALAHMKAFKRLDDQGRALAASTNAALMSAQFDFTNQNLRITQLKAGQLERDIALTRSRARLTAVITAALLIGGGAALAVTILGFLSMRRSRNRIRAANDKLNLTNTALEKALRAKTEFLATTSHEIRTPLNGILGMAQVILADRNAPPAIREKVQLMQGAGTTMRALVDDLLDMAKIETGSIVIETAPFAVGKVLGETVQFWTDQAAARGVSLRLDAAPLPARGLGDETRLRQVLYNLMSNALKFTERGEILLTAAYEGETLTFSIKDSGIGIAPEKLDLIFEAFAQADSSTSRKYGGAGLGLAICRSICEAMGGSIRVDSTPGEGSTFTVAVPIPAADTGASGPAADLASASVLLLDANPLSRNIVRALVAPQARAVEAAGGLIEALDHLSVAGADLVVADGAALKGETGVMATNAHTLKRALPQGRLAVLLAAPDADQAPLLSAAGVDAVILKPLAGPALLAQLGRMFDRAEVDAAVA